MKTQLVAWSVLALALGSTLATSATRKPPLSVTLDSPTAQVMPTLTFTIKPYRGVAPLSVKLTWNAVNALGCNASGLWSGVKPTSGTETIVTSTKGKVVLACYGATPDAIVSWTIPTLNTDGSTITNLAGFNLFVSTDSGAVNSASPIKIENPTATTYTVSGLPVGMNYFSMQAYNSNGAVSSYTGQVSTDIPAQAIALSRFITITEYPPEPPTDITVNGNPATTHDDH